MALRGDSIDNIPGAPGIGDKGSVEIIKRFGTVEQALDRAAEVEKKTYRESLLNNRDTILFSKSMATIDTNVPVELDVDVHAGRRAGCGRAARAFHRTRIHLAAEGIAAGRRGERRRTTARPSLRQMLRACVERRRATEARWRWRSSRRSRPPSRRKKRKKRSRRTPSCH